MKTLLALLVVVVTVSLVGTSSAEDGKKGMTTVTGKVKAIDSKSVTLEGRTKEGKPVGPPQTFDLAEDVMVKEGPDAKALADVKVGATVTLTFSQDKKTVTAIALPKKGKERE